MSSIIKTRTQGFRVYTFRNQEVHKYYSHLQSVMRSIDENGTYNELFAKPEIDSMAVGATEIEWTCSENGKAVHISQLPEAERNRIEKIVTDAFNKIDTYISDNRDKSGKFRDYAQFLAIVGKRPDSNQIWVINRKPIIVQWGFADENGLMGSSGIYSDWDSFIKDIKREEPQKVEEPEKIMEKVAPMASPSLFAEQEKSAEEVVEKPAEPPKPSDIKPKEPEPKPTDKKEAAPVDTEEPQTVMAGLGSYVWVKWLAIVLFIIILLLLLFRLIPRNDFGRLGNNGGNMGAISGSLGGGGGDSGGQGGGVGDGNGAGNGAGGQGNNGNNGNNGADNAGGNPAVNPDDNCPVCSQPFRSHGPEDYKKCIRQASSRGGAGNGKGSGAPAGSEQNGIAGGNSGSGDGNGAGGQGNAGGNQASGDANGAGGQGNAGGNPASGDANGAGEQGNAGGNPASGNANGVGGQGNAGSNPASDDANGAGGQGNAGGNPASGDANGAGEQGN
ncbi:MAG: hypothetical protein II961_04770, partial [Candidatus Riflebacteria bacterium]|nr:hypothetical protein [Candidatus Riflebacteria bacterium]